MAQLRAFYFHGVNNRGNTIGDTFYYDHEPCLQEILDDVRNYVIDEGAAFDYEHETRSKWYGGFDDLGWVMDAEEDRVRYGD